MADQKVNGILVRGGDGSCYFLPEPLLAKFKLDDDQRDRASALFEDEVAGFDYGQQLDSFDVPIVATQAIEGPLGIAKPSVSWANLEQDAVQVQLDSPRGLR